MVQSTSSVVSGGILARGLGFRIESDGRAALVDRPLMVQWDQISQPEYDRCVEALVRREYPDATVLPLDGRGGDGGIDILITEKNGRTTIFQLKFFPEGFSGGWAKTRRPQITKSYRAAMKNRPHNWILVYPGTLTPGEKQFVDQLSSPEHAPSEQSAWYRSDLDSKFAHHFDLLASFVRPHLLHMVDLYRMEPAPVLANVHDDLPKRLAGLAEVTGAIDPYWTLDWGHDERGVSWSVRAKHANASTVSPLSWNITVNLAGQSPEVLEAVRRSIGYGLESLVRLPPEAVPRLEFNGPEWLRKVETHVGVEWQILGSVIPENAAFELRFPSSGAMFGGATTFGNQGTQGYSLRGTIGAATVELLIPRDITAPGTIQFAYRMGHASSTVDVLQAAKLTQHLHGEVSVEVFLEGRRLCLVNLVANPATWRAEDLAKFSDLIRKAEDIDAVQRHCNVYFPMPASATYFELASYRAIRLMLDGHRVTLPHLRQISVTLSGQDDPALRQMLTEPGWIRIQAPGYTMEIGSRTFRLGTVNLLAQAEVIDAREALKKLGAGEAAGVQVEIRPLGEISRPSCPTTFEAQQTARWS